MKNYYLILDTETTITDKVVDFGAVVCDTKGNIVAQCAVIISGIFGVDDLFYDQKSSGIWARNSIDRRMANYNAMLNNGTRMLASVSAVNRWLEKVAAKYNPTLTAYNLAFDNSKCINTGIDLSMFSNRFCLWQAAVGNICNTKDYRRFIISNHLFNNKTIHGNMTFSTTAEAVTGYLVNNMTNEPHTALEDIIGYELPTLVYILKRKNWKSKITPYNWKAHQVKDYFVAR
jgi:hypothetical protein